VVVLNIESRPRLDQDDVRAECPGVGHVRACLNPVSLRLVAGSDAARALRIDRDNAYRLPTQLRSQLLLDGREVGVEIDEEPVDRAFSHKSL
jgi:hypothetical protein